MNIPHNLAHIHQRITAAAQRAGRDPATITLVAVSKTKPISDIQAALAAGQLDFGENRLEELSEKVPFAQQLGLEQSIRWHMIGSIQSRKSGDMVDLWRRGHFALIHSVDTVKLTRRLSRDAQAANLVLSILLEVNISGEASKHGFTPAELRASWPELINLPALHIAGLMTMAPLEVEPEATRPVFRGLRQLRDELVAAYPHHPLPHLSMGMTNDFEVAIEEGATIVRIGSAIFGSIA